MSYFDDIDNDYKKLKEVLINNFGILECFEDNKFEESKLSSYHSLLFKLRDLITESETFPDFSLKGLDNGISDFLDFIWLVYVGRYKSAIASLRNGLDIFGRGLIRINNGALETNSFSNNMEKVLKDIRLKNEVRIHGSHKRKQHKKYINKNFTEKIIDMYGVLSNSIHGKDENYSNLSQYIDSSLDFVNNQNVDMFNEIIDLACKVIQLLISTFILINYDYLDSRMNTYKLNIIIDSVGEPIKSYKFGYLSNHF